jgi:hypothetical protein
VLEIQENSKAHLMQMIQKHLFASLGGAAGWSDIFDHQRNCYETNLDIANHGMGIRDGWLQFKLSQERHQ